MSYSLYFIKNLEQSIWAAQEKEDSVFPVGKHKHLYSEQTPLCWLWLGLEQLHLAQAGRAQRGGLPARLMASSRTPALPGCYKQGFLPPGQAALAGIQATWDSRYYKYYNYCNYPNERQEKLPNPFIAS